MKKISTGALGKILIKHKNGFVNCTKVDEEIGLGLGNLVKKLKTLNLSENSEQVKNWLCGICREIGCEMVNSSATTVSRLCKELLGDNVSIFLGVSNIIDAFGEVRTINKSPVGVCGIHYEMETAIYYKNVYVTSVKMEHSLVMNMDTSGQLNYVNESLVRMMEYVLYVYYWLEADKYEELNTIKECVVRNVNELEQELNDYARHNGVSDEIFAMGKLEPADTTRQYGVKSAWTADYGAFKTSDVLVQVIEQVEEWLRANGTIVTDDIPYMNIRRVRDLEERDVCEINTGDLADLDKAMSDRLVLSNKKAKALGLNITNVMNSKERVREVMEAFLGGVGSKAKDGMNSILENEGSSFVIKNVRYRLYDAGVGRLDSGESCLFTNYDVYITIGSVKTSNVRQIKLGVFGKMTIKSDTLAYKIEPRLGYNELVQVIVLDNEALRCFDGGVARETIAFNNLSNLLLSRLGLNCEKNDTKDGVRFNKGLYRFQGRNVQQLQGLGSMVTSNLATDVCKACSELYNAE